MKPLIGIVAGVQDEASENPWDRSDKLPRTYGEAVAAAGGIPIILPAGDDEDTVSGALATLSGVLISGGADIDPVLYGDREHHATVTDISKLRDAMDNIVVRSLLERDLPCFGICRGIQSLNAFAGGTLYQDVPSQIGTEVCHRQTQPGREGTHEIAVSPDSRLAQILGCGTALVNSFHHQAVRDLAPGFVVSATARDGVIEAIERPAARFCLAVQFHPEVMAPYDALMRRLFEAFVVACRP